MPDPSVKPVIWCSKSNKFTSHTRNLYEGSLQCIDNTEKGIIKELLCRAQWVLYTDLRLNHFVQNALKSVNNISLHLISTKTNSGNVKYCLNIITHNYIASYCVRVIPSKAQVFITTVTIKNCLYVTKFNIKFNNSEHNNKFYSVLQFWNYFACPATAKIISSWCFARVTLLMHEYLILAVCTPTIRNPSLKTSFYRNGFSSPVLR